MSACALNARKSELKQTNITECRGTSAGFVFSGANNSFVEYSAFENMNATNDIMTFAICAEGTVVRKCNFIKNSGKYLVVPIFIDCLDFNECIFAKNNAENMFIAGFGNITIFHCILNDNSFSTTFNGTEKHSFNTSYMTTSNLEISLKLINWSMCETIKLYISNKDDHDYTPLFSAALFAFIFSRLK